MPKNSKKMRKGTTICVGASCCYKCGKVYVHQGGSSMGYATKRTEIQCRLHKKRCEGELELSKEQIRVLLNVAIDEYVNNIKGGADKPDGGLTCLDSNVVFEGEEAKNLL